MRSYVRLSLFSVLWLAAQTKDFCAQAVRIGQNFRASTFGVDSPAIPPDSNGAIGPQHFVEFINGRFAVFDKSKGQLVQGMSDVAFWTNAGVALTATQDVTDPRVVFDA